MKNARTKKLDFSEYARALGSIKTPRKAEASRRNGMLGGRPPKNSKDKVQSTDKEKQ